MSISLWLIAKSVPSLFKCSLCFKIFIPRFSSSISLLLHLLLVILVLSVLCFCAVALFVLSFSIWISFAHHFFLLYSMWLLLGLVRPYFFPSFIWLCFLSFSNSLVIWGVSFFSSISGLLLRRDFHPQHSFDLDFGQLAQLLQNWCGSLLIAQSKECCPYLLPLVCPT